MSTLVNPAGYECIRHEETDFPIAYHYDLLGPDFSVLLHWHEDLEILYFRKGSANIISDGISITANTGDIAFLGPYYIHKLENITDVCEYHCIIISLDFFRNVPFFEANYPSFTLTRNPGITGLMDKIIEELHQKERSYEVVVQGILVAMIACLNRIANDSDKNRISSFQHYDKVRQTIKYIHEHFKEKITIKDICAVVDYSESYLNMCFRKVTGMSIIDFLNNFRCEHAHRLIRSGKYSISECAEMSGFYHMSYFTRSYKKQFGVTPSETKNNAERNCQEKSSRETPKK